MFDPRVRLAACLGFLGVLAVLDRPGALVLALAVGVAAVVLTRLPAGGVVGRLLVVEGFLVAVLVTFPFLLPGRPMVTVLGFAASWEGLVRAGIIVLRINAAVLMTTALLGGLGSAGIARAMTGIGLPPRLGQLMQMTVRYIGLFDGEYHQLRRAMRARGFRAGSNRHSWRTLGNLMGMLLVRSFERAERVRGAMACRGFSGRFLMPPPRALTAADLGFATAGGLVVATLMVLEFL